MHDLNSSICENYRGVPIVVLHLMHMCLAMGLSGLNRKCKCDFFTTACVTFAFNDTYGTQLFIIRLQLACGVNLFKYLYHKLVNQLRELKQNDT